MRGNGSEFELARFLNLVPGDVLSPETGVQEFDDERCCVLLLLLFVVKLYIGFIDIITLLCTPR